MHRLYTICLLVIIPSISEAQDCSCADEFQWVKETFENNDAGFRFSLEQKGEDVYREHNKTFEKRVSSIDDHARCVPVLYEWLQFFRSGHFSIGMKNASTETGDEPNKEELAERFSRREISSTDPATFESQVLHTDPSNLLGIWQSGPYKIGVENTVGGYQGFIIEADGFYWKPGQIKFDIREEDEGLTSTYYMQDHSPREMSDVRMIGKNFLQIGFVQLERVSPHFESDESVERYFELSSASSPLFKKLNSESVLLRIPSFSFDNKAKIDSLISLHKETILSTKKLIIDIRNNGGGADVSYDEIIPILYTNPIRVIGLEYLSTKLNNQRMIDFANNPDWAEEDRKWARDSFEILKDRPGEFVNVDTVDVDIQTHDTVHPYPEKVAILINENNGSTAEQFLLAARQSSKVKLYGRTTVGVLDVSNMHFVDSPCDSIYLGYSLTRSMRIPHMAIDDKGIMPDYYMHDDIPIHRWIDFVLDQWQN